jgi:hypothetical protein
MFVNFATLISTENSYNMDMVRYVVHGY